MSVNQDTLKQIVEAAVMAAEAPLSPRQIAALFPEDAAPETDDIKEAISALQEDCESRGVELKKVGKGYRYQTREHLAPWLRKLNEGRPPRYSRALLETLAIIAYRQPVTRGDIEDIRGVAVSSDIMRVLQERDWVKQVGVRDVPGHPALYGTTPGFLGYFNLESLRELPALIEQRDLEDIARDQNIQLPITLTEVNEERADQQDGDSELAAETQPDNSHEQVAADSDESEAVSEADMGLCAEPKSEAEPDSAMADALTDATEVDRSSIDDADPPVTDIADEPAEVSATEHTSVDDEEETSTENQH